ncbi:MAG: sel1 repeat family protein [Proteobacteria bacterium]|nr:sel1 repeat family protein [Pseudomonadota bacterium]
MKNAQTCRSRFVGFMAIVVSLCLSLSPALAQKSAYEDSVEGALAALGDGDATEAQKIFWRLAGRNDAEAEYYIATMLDAGQGMGKDIYSAASWFHKSAELGYLPAMVSIGYAYSTGHGVTKNDKEAFKWYSKAANMGDAVAQNNLGTMFRDGIGVEKDPRLAEQWFLRSAMQGTPRAQYNLANMYHKGEGVTVSDVEAARWYTGAAKQGDVYAQEALGTMYRLGQGVTKDLAQALEWYRQAAEKGYVTAQVALARMYETGEGGDKSQDDAALWYLRAAKQGNAFAQYRVGLFYERGLGFSQDLKRAMTWYKKSVDEGKYVPGMGALCRLYSNGTDDVKVEAALAMYQKGASAGDPYCQLILGRMCDVGGPDLKKNPIQAYQWFALAAAALPEGEEKASAVVKRIEISNSLSEQQLNEARKKVSEWKPVILPGVRTPRR